MFRLVLLFSEKSSASSLCISVFMHGVALGVVALPDDKKESLSFNLAPNDYLK